MIKFFFRLLVFLLLPWQISYALPPPDLIITALQSVVQVFGALVAMMIVFAFSTWQWMKLFYQTHRRMVLTMGALLVLAFPLSVGGILWYQQDLWRNQVQTEFLSMADQAREELQEDLKDQTQTADLTATQLEKVLAEIDKMTASSSDTMTRIMDLNFSGALDYEPFKQKLTEPDMQIVDVRTRLGFEKGRIEGSQNIELPDLLFGGWKSLDPNKPVMIVCYAGSSGVVASDFLTSIGFSEVYFPTNGIYKYQDQLADFNFQGEYFDPYSGIQQKIITLDQVQAKAVEIIDFRPAEVVKTNPIKPIVTNPDIALYVTKRLEKWLNSLDKEATYAFVCDSPISCYNSAIMTHHFKTKNLDLKGTLFTKGTWGAWVTQ